LFLFGGLEKGERGKTLSKKLALGVWIHLVFVFAFAILLLCQTSLPFAESRFAEPSSSASRHP